MYFGSRAAKEVIDPGSDLLPADNNSWVLGCWVPRSFLFAPDFTRAHQEPRGKTFQFGQPAVVDYSLLEVNFKAPLQRVLCRWKPATSEEAGRWLHTRLLAAPVASETPPYIRYCSETSKKIKIKTQWCIGR